MPDSSSGLLLRTARLGDRARRSQAARQLIATLAPWTAAVSCAAAILSAVLGGPRWIGLLLLGASASAAGLFLLTVRRERSTPDHVVVELDRAAALDGALRSAHWFATAGDRSTDPAADQAWVTFHLGAAASRAERVDWAAVFPVRPAGRRWVASLALAAGAAAVLGWPSPWRVPAARAAPPGAPAAAAATSIPSALVPTLVEGIRAIETGRRPSRDALSAIGEALELARSDPRAKRELDQLLTRPDKESSDPGGWSPFYDDTGVYRSDYEASWWQSGAGALEWAYQDAASRASVDDKAPAVEAPPSDPAAAQGGDTQAGEDAGSGGSGTPGGTPAQADVRGDAGRFSALLFGAQRASDDARGAPVRKAADRAALAAALRREVVHAPDDIAGEHRDERGARRATNANMSRTPRVEAAGSVRYDKSRATRPPAVPEARQAIVHDVFIRRPERGAVPGPP